MLGRTANGLYWMFRYIERAENIARLLGAAMRVSLTRSGSGTEDWDGVLQSTGLIDDYLKVHDKVTQADAIDFLLRERSTNSSVMCCIEHGRNNARMVRTALTRETWEATNEFWIAMKALTARKTKTAELPDVVDEIKNRAGLVRGAFHGTMLRNELYNFAKLGTSIERADSTARILNTKYYVLLPAASSIVSSIENAQWESILRSVSAHRAYGWVYDGEYNASNIADFLILNEQMPRSLAYCYGKIVGNLNFLSRTPEERLPAHQTAEAIYATLKEASIKQVMDRGLHDFLEDFVAKNAQLDQEITTGYRFYQ